MTCAVQLSSGTHTLYDLDAQTWQPPLLVLGQPGQCDYCYQAPVLLIVPSVLARASQLPSGSVAAYMSRLTFYGVSSPSIASVQVSSLYTLQVGVLDGIVSTAGYTGPPVYTLQSATSNVTAIQVATLTSAALYMTLRAVQLSVLETGSWSLLLTRAETTTLYSSSRLILSGASQLVVSGAVWTVAAGDSSAGLGLVFSSASRVQINASTSFVVSVPLILAAQAVVIIGPAATLAASAFLNATSCQVSGAGTLYLSGGSSWSAGSQVTCAVQLSSGTHTLYDLDAQTWQPPLLVLGQPGQCDYCYQAPVLLIVPSVLARASQLPSGSVAAYMSRLTFYGVSSPSIASVQVSSLYTLQVGVLDGIVSTAGYTGPPVYTLQSATSNVTAIQVATLTSAALYMTLRAVQLSVLETGSWSLLLTRAETTTLYSSSRLILSGASQLVVSGAVWTVAAGDSSAGLGLVFSSASRVQINASSSLVVRVPVTVPVGAALSIGLAGALTLSSPVSLSQATIQIAAGGALAASGYVTAASCQVSGAGTLYLSGGSSWSAGSQVTCAVQLSSGTHTLYDLDAQTWQPPLLVLGQPGQCDYCYQAPVLLIVPSVLARASQLPSGSVAAYMSRLTFYGVSSPSIASVQVSSLYTLQVGVLDGIVSTAGYTGPPVYTLQSATSNVTAIQVATLTSAALYMTLRAVQLSVLETGSWSLLLTRAETTTLYSSSRLILSGASQLVVSGAVWTVAAGDSSAGLGLVFSSASRGADQRLDVIRGQCAPHTRGTSCRHHRPSSDVSSQRLFECDQLSGVRRRHAVPVRRLVVVRRQPGDLRCAAVVGHAHAVRPGRADVAAAVARAGAAWAV